MSFAVKVVAQNTTNDFGPESKKEGQKMSVMEIRTTLQLVNILCVFVYSMGGQTTFRTMYNRYR